MDWNGKKVLITGVSGFLGSNLARELLNNGAIIYSIDNFSYIDYEITKKKIAPLLHEVKIISGDVSQKESWDSVPGDIEYIFHLAGPSSITLFKRWPEKCYYETVFGLYHVLEFAKNHNVKKIVYTSTGSLYAGNRMPHREELYPIGYNLYAAAKIACEALANSYSNHIKILGLRVFAGFGPGEERKKDFASVICLFAKDALDGKRPVIYGDGNQIRDFVHVDDVVKALLRGSEIEETGIINVGTGKGITFNEIWKAIKDHIGTNIEPEYIEKEVNYVEELEADTFKMRKILKMMPQPTEDGIRRFLDYLKDNGDLYSSKASL
jgi:UDP-glucose 4-epimerase